MAGGDKTQHEMAGDNGRMQKKNILVKSIFHLKWMTKGERVVVIIVMRSGIPPMFIRIPKCIRYK